MSEQVITSAFAVNADRWAFRGVLTFDNAMAVLDAASSLPLPKSGVVDLSGLDHADSAALAVLLALRRRAKTERHHPLKFEGVPAMLDSLARVYGIEDLIVA